MHLSQIVVGQNVSVLSGQLELLHSAFEIASSARFGGEALWKIKLLLFGIEKRRSNQKKVIFSLELIFLKNKNIYF